MSADEKQPRKARVSLQTSPIDLAVASVPTRQLSMATAVNRVAYTKPGAYKTGDGDVLSEPRPGSFDFLKHPSKGYAC